MEIFIAWSGARGKQVGEAFANWLPDVIQTCNPFFSPDMEKGLNWSPKLSEQLQETDFGIVCITEDSTNAPWLLFEAGALSKKMEKSRVCTFLYDIKNAKLDGPLSKFQWTIYSKDDIQKLVADINKNNVPELRLTDERLKSAFEKYWPDLDEKLKNIPPCPTETVEKTTAEREMLEELLETTRKIESSLTKKTTYSKTIQTVDAATYDGIAELYSKASPSMLDNRVDNILASVYTQAFATLRAKEKDRFITSILVNDAKTVEKVKKILDPIKAGVHGRGGEGILVVVFDGLLSPSSKEEIESMKGFLDIEIHERRNKGT
ncbi:MAG: TIR domain-containing protein [Thermoplasmata archaeon]|nr:TIR domain-containing protein [Thermoplasmata archaeon]